LKQQPPGRRGKHGGPQHKGSIILAFTPRSAYPVLGAHIAGTTLPVLLFTGQGMPQYAAQAHTGGRELRGVTMSSLLILREDRSYTYLGASSPMALPGMVALQVAQQQQQQQGTQSRFESVFGPAVAVSSGSAAQGAAAAGEGTAHTIVTRTQALFDSPSHVLPAPASLAQLYLQVLVGA
jgi:hypothetical protein